MDKISIFSCSAKQLKWMKIALIAVIVVLFYEDFVYPTVHTSYGNVVAMGLKPIVESGVMRVLTNLVNLIGMCFLFEMLRRALKPSSKTAAALMMVIIAMKVLSRAYNIASIFVISDDVEFMVYHQNLIQFMQGIQAGISLVDFLVILWLSILLMGNYAGRVRDLSSAWLTSVFGPVILNLFFGMFVNGANYQPGGMMSYVFAALMFVCSCLAPVFIYRCFKVEEK